MKSLITIISLTLGVGASVYAGDVPLDSSKFHIFLLMGQSNMAGSGYPRLDEYREPNPNVLWYVRSSDAWKQSKIPGAGSVGPGTSFARQYAELHPGITVGLIMCAIGGRSIQELSKGGQDKSSKADNYGNSLKVIKTASQQGVIKGVLWHQGESNSGDNEYSKRLINYVTTLRTDLDQPDLPFIYGELGKFFGSSEKFNKQLAAIGATIPRSALVSSAELQDKGDRLHFSGFAVEVLGLRYLNEYLRITEPETVAKLADKLLKTTLMAKQREEEWKIVFNGDMTLGAQEVTGWNSPRCSAGNAQTARDTKVFHSAPSSLLIESVQGASSGSITVPIRKVTGKTIKVSAFVKNQGFATLKWRMDGMDLSWKFGSLNVDVASCPVIDEWTQVVGTAKIPTNMCETDLILKFDGVGKAWVDDVAVEITENESDDPVKEKSFGVLNPEMSEGSAIPGEWETTWASKGKIKVLRDTKEFKSEPASLKIESVGGPVNMGICIQDVPRAPAGATVEVSGWMKSDGKTKAAIMCVPRDKSGKLLKFYNLSSTSSAEWVSFAKQLTLPADVDSLRVSPCLEGEGAAWFDDVRVKVVK